MSINKKAVLSASFIVGLIITLAAFTLIGGTLGRFISAAEPKQAEAICQSSIAFRATTTIRDDGKTIGLSPLLCKTQDAKLSGKKGQLMDKIAQKLARCWWIFGQGKYEQILDAEQVSRTFGLSKTKNDCFLCYSLILEDKDFKGKITSQELIDYMSTHKYAKANQTYLNYIQSSGGPGRVGILTSGIETGKAYGISFMAKNSKDKSWFAEKLGATALGVGVTAGYFLCPITGGTTCVLAAAATATLGTYSLGTGANNKIQNIYTERDVSSIYLDNLKSAQNSCFKGDLAGQ